MPLVDSDVTDAWEVLIVESSPTQVLKLRHLLDQHGCRTVSARNGREALVILESRVPSLILSDAVLPDTDGYALCRQIKAQPALQDVPVVLMASLEDPQTIIRLLECGADDVLPKPYDDDGLTARMNDIRDTHRLRRRASEPDSVAVVLAGEERRLPPERVHERLDMLLSLFQIGAQRERRLRQLRETVEIQMEELKQSTEPPLPAPPPGPSLRVLLAEDSDVNQRLGARTLEKHGHTVVVVGDGRQALAALEREAFDLILMDIEMPEMSGLEATAAIRQMEQRTGVHIPVVAMTAHTAPADIQKCFAAGMDDAVSKPIQMETLAPILDRLITSEVVFDRQAALASVEGDAELLREIVGLFLEEAPRLLNAIRDAIARQDRQTLERSAHSLKGSAASLGAVGVVPAAQALENLGREGVFGEAQAALPSLEAALASLSPLLEAV